MNKKYLIGGGIVLVLIILIYSCSGSDKEEAVTDDIAGLVTPAADAPAEQEVAPEVKVDPKAADIAKIKELTEKINKNYNDGDAFYQRGVVYGRLGQYSLAISDYTDALRVMKDSANAYFNRALMYEHRKDFSKALEDYNSAIKYRPEDARFYNSRALVYVEMGNLEAAAADYQQAITLNPEYAQAYFNLGTLYERQDNHKAAIEQYTKAIDLHTEANKDPSAKDHKHHKREELEAYYRRAVISMNMDDLTTAMNDVNFIIAQDPKYVKAYRLRAIIYTKVGNTAGAAVDEGMADTLSLEEMLHQ